MFFTILLLLEAGVVLQALLSYFDGYLTKDQMRSRGIRKGYSFFQHGGMWVDVFIISPLIAFVLTRYDLPLLGTGSVVIAAVAVTAVFLILWAYAAGSVQSPEAHAHSGHTTPAGFVHGIYALVGLWAMGMFYLVRLSPPPSTLEIVLVSTLLTFFFPVGVWKFSNEWSFKREDRIQVGVSIAALWTMAILKIVL